MTQTHNLLTPNGRFLARAVGEATGNVLLRRIQYRCADNPNQSCRIARNMVFGKVFNCRWSIERTMRDNGMRVDLDKLKNASTLLKNALADIRCAQTLESLRDLEGETAAVYFSVLCFADRFVLSMINNRTIKPGDFEKRESGAVVMTDEGKKTIIRAWQERKHDEITHPYLKEKLPWGLVPYVQALLLAQYFRDELDEYPPFLWK